MNFLINFSIRFLSKLVSLTPVRVRWAIADLITWLAFDVFRFRRFTLLKNLQRVYPELSLSEKKKLAKTSIRHLAFNLIEFLLIPRVRMSLETPRFRIEGREHYDQAAAKDKGVLLLSMHIGHGDMCISLLGHAGFPLTVVSKVFNNKISNEFWFALRGHPNVEFLPPHGNELPFKILKALKDKRCVAFVIDQFMSVPYGILSTFFGYKTGSPFGLSVFAAKSKAPVVPVHCYREPDGVFVIAFSPEVLFEKKEPKDIQLLHMTEKYNRVVEQLILQHPEQWMWIHRRWKEWG